MTKKQFLGKSLAEMISTGVTVQFNKRIYNSKHSYDFFNEGPPAELKINYFDDDINTWFPIYVHEYCHFLQWKNENEKWDAYNKDIIKLNLFLDNKRKSIQISSVRKVQEVELDCDRKVLQLIKKYKLDIDVEKYIKDSNLYIYCHNYFPRYKKFFTPFNKELLDLMPKTLFSLKHLECEINGLEQLYVDAYNKEFKLVK